MLARSLTFRERQIVQLVVEAMPNKEIADRLHLTEGTIKEYMNRILRKLEIKSRTALAVWAVRNFRARMAGPGIELGGSADYAHVRRLPILKPTALWGLPIAMARFVMRPQQVATKIVAEIAPHRMDVVGIVLCVIKFDQER